MGAETTNERFETAKQLLNYGFSNYKIETLTEKGVSFGTANVSKGKVATVNAVTESSFKRLSNSRSGNKTETKTTIYKDIKAPVYKGDEIGKIEFTENGKPVGEVKLVAENDVKRLNIIDVFGIFIAKWLLK